VFFLWTEGRNAKDMHKKMFPVYSGKCLLSKAVHNWVDKFWILWSNLLDLYIACYNISQIIIFDWTLSISDHTTLIQYIGTRVTHCYTASGLPSQKTRPLPSKVCLLLSRALSSNGLFTKNLVSAGTCLLSRCLSMDLCHNTFCCFRMTHGKFR
jgi:hypothetical protein